jgi:hypothetical protein
MRRPSGGPGADRRSDVKGIRDDMRKAVERLEHDEPEKYGRLAAIIAGGSG